jgi:sugar diacid utilization regulator
VRPHGSEPERETWTRGVERRRAVRAVAGRIARRKRELAGDIVDKFRAEVVDYGVSDDQELMEGAFEFALGNIEALLDGLEHGGPLPEEQLDRIRVAAARRLHQRVSLEAFVHAGRVWARVVWEAVLDSARVDRPQEREVALELAGRVMNYIDAVSTTGARAYLDELNDRGLLRQDLLDALISGHGDAGETRRQARSLHLRLGENYVVVVLRAAQMEREEANEPPLATRVALDRIVAATRNHLRPSAAALLAGMHQRDVVALYPVSEPGEVVAVKRDCAALVDSLSVEVSVGMSGWHAGMQAIAIAYEEALDAVEIAAATGTRGRAVVLEEVLIEHMLRSSTHADRILAEALQPLVDYDRAHQASLVATLRAYVETRLNLTRSAETLRVHPNTVVYRLRRIRELSGRDPGDADDLLVLALGLKLRDLQSSA